MCARQYSSRSRSSGGCSFNVLVGAGSAGAAVPTMAAAVRTVTGMRSLLTAASSGVSAAGGRFAGFTVGAVQRRGVKTIKRRIRKPPTKNYKMKTKKAGTKIYIYIYIYSTTHAHAHAHALAHTARNYPVRVCLCLHIHGAQKWSARQCAQRYGNARPSTLVNARPLSAPPLYHSMHPSATACTQYLCVQGWVCMPRYVCCVCDACI